MPEPSDNAASRADRRLFECFNARDWAGVEALAAPGLVFDERRRMLHNTCGRDIWLEQFRVLFDVPKSRFTTVLRATRGDRLSLNLHCFEGEVAEGGGPLAMDDHLVLHEVDGDGRIVAIVLFDLEDKDAAYAELDARYEAGEGTAPQRFANAATGWMERLWATFDAGDFDAARAIVAPGFTWEDRRPLFRLTGDFELMLASAKERLATGARHERRSIVGTAGDCIAIARVLWAGGPPEGRFEVEFLALYEVDAAGLCTALIFFDPDDARAVQREAWVRWAASEPDVAATIGLIADLCDAFDAHDPVRWRALCADDLVYEDHRRTGIGLLEGREAFVDSLVALWDLAPLTRVEAGWFWPAYGRHGAVTVVRRSGTLPDGGAFESEYLELFVQAGGRATHLELFELNDLDAARARFEELRAVSAR